MNPPSHQDVDVHLPHDRASAPAADFVRMPGLLRRWELPEIVQPATDYQIESAGETRDGTPVFAVYHREQPPEDNTDITVPVTVFFEDDQRRVRARLMRLDRGDPIMGVLVVSHDPNDAGLLARVREHLAHAPPRPDGVPALATATSAAGSASTEASSCSRKA